MLYIELRPSIFHGVNSFKDWFQQLLENEINALIAEESKLDKDIYPEPEPLINMRPSDIETMNTNKDAYYEPR